MALASAGFTVEVVCPSGHPVKKTSAVQRTFPYHALTPLTSIADAIAATTPDLIIPADDLATCHLHGLFYRERSRGTATAAICSLIERSLGPSDSFPVVYARTRVMQLAQEENIRVPKTSVIATIDDLRKWADQVGFPTVLKADGTSAGKGVRIVHTLQEAERAFRDLAAPPFLLRSVKRALVDQDLTLIRPLLLRRRSVVNAQSFVAGREATSLVASWNGTVLAGVHFEVLNKQDSTGPASVLRLIEDPEMSKAAEKLVRRLKLSGLHGFDFMLEANTGSAYLIELNPRTTQVGHLRLGPGRDIPAALYAAASGIAVEGAPMVTKNDTIALFPQEWTRNPASVFLRSSYHDVPWEEPALIRDCVRRRWTWGAWYAQRKWVQALFRPFGAFTDKRSIECSHRAAWTANDSQNRESVTDASLNSLTAADSEFPRGS